MTKRIDIPEDGYLPRIADDLLAHKLKSSGAVQVKGPKWCGKTTTAERQSKSSVFLQDPDKSASLLALAETKPSACSSSHYAFVTCEYMRVLLGVQCSTIVIKPALKPMPSYVLIMENGHLWK